MLMRRLVFSVSVLSLASIGSAMAADMPVKAPIYTAPPAITYNWTGCYIGGNVGGGWTNIDQSQVGKVNGVAINPPGNFGSAQGSNVVGGGQIGCDYQLGNWVVGAQGMFDFGNINSSHVLPAFPTFNAQDRTKNLFTATARLGYLAAPALLAYVKGGGAWARTDSSVFGTVPATFLSESTSTSRFGWTVGAGLEWMFTPNWSVFGEYNYMDFGRKDVSYVQAPGTVGFADVVSTRLTVQQVLIGVNYKFNWGL